MYDLIRAVTSVPTVKDVVEVANAVGPAVGPITEDQKLNLNAAKVYAAFFWLWIAYHHLYPYGPQILPI